MSNPRFRGTLLSRLLLVPIFALVALILIPGCVEDPDLSRNIVKFHISSQPDGLHPFNNNSGNRTIVFNYTQRTLIKLDLDSLGSFPVLIESLPEISDDQLFYTYRLKEGIKWDNGEELTAKDVAFTTKIQVCPLTDNAAIRGIYDQVIKDVILYPDDPYKFTMEANKVYASNADIYSEIYIQQQSHWDPTGILDSYTIPQFYEDDFKMTAGKDIQDWMAEFNNAENSFTPEKLVGLGPYQITEWETDGYIELTRKENWWGEGDELIYQQAYPDKILFMIIKDAASAKMELKNQNLDVSTMVGNSSLLKLQKLDYFNEAFSSEFVPEYAYAYIGLNMRPDASRTPFFTDVRVRKAMQYATPVDEIIEVLVYGNGQRQMANVSPLKSAYNGNLHEYPFNLDSAAYLLEQAGWVDTDGDNIRDKMINGKKVPFSFGLHYFGNSTLSKETSAMIKEEMYKVGVVVNTIPLDFTILYKKAYEHDFDAMTGVWGGSGGYSDPIQLWGTDAWVNKGSNFVGFGDAESDSLIELCNTKVNKSERDAAQKLLQRKIYDESPYIVLYSRVRPTVIHNRFENQEMYSEKPGLHTNALKLRPEFASNLELPLDEF